MSEARKLKMEPGCFFHDYYALYSYLFVFPEPWNSYKWALSKKRATTNVVVTAAHQQGAGGGTWGYFTRWSGQ